jgi:DNA-binding response OmpR family regulator
MMSEGPTILVIDDDPAMRLGLQDNLEIEGYRVLTAGSLRDGFQAAIAQKPDLVLLDLMLPDGDGIALCRQLRRHGFDQPIIMLTARGEEMDKVLGFEVGSDDYVVKPFSLPELLARIRVRLRRTVGTASVEGEVVVGVATVDFRRHTLTQEESVIEISAKELDLLHYLVIHRGEVVTRDILLTEVWGHSWQITTRTVDNFIARLRKKIEPDPAVPRYLLTVHGRGYKLVEQ